MGILRKLKSWVRRYPFLKVLLLPAYLRMLNISWLMRKFIFRLPVRVYAGQIEIQLHPEGSIPEILFKGDFEPGERDFVASFVKPGMTVVDAGANVGFYSILASVLVAGEGCVHSFEPGRLTFKRLLQNLELNNCKNVVPSRTALSNKKKEVIFSVDPLNPTLDSHCFIRTDSDKLKLAPTDEIVTCQTLDEYFSACDKRTVDFIKIDVEGSELELLQGAEATLAASPKIVILLECTKNREQVWGLLKKKGFNCFVWDSSKRGLSPAVYSEVVCTSNVILCRN